MSPRKIVQDMVPSSAPKMPLREVMPVSRRGAGHRHISPHVVRADRSEPEEVVTKHREIPESKPVILERPQRPRRPMRRHPLFIFIVLLLCVAAILWAINFVYAKATIVITPVKEAVTVNNSFTVCKDTPCTTSNLNATGALTYEVVQIPSVELHEVVPAVPGPLAQTNAQGMIVLYNNYSTAPQTIVGGTHLTNSAGLVYKTQKTVVIPGLKKAGGATVPGSASVSIVASAAGPSSNINPTDLTGDFSVIAYKGTSKYTTIYGRLNPNNSISGGSSGVTFVVSSSSLAEEYTSLKQNLAANLLAQSQSSIPQGYIMFNNAYTIQYTQLPPVVTSSTSSSADVGVRATFYGIMFKENDLVKAIVQAALPSISMSTLFPDDAFVTPDITGLVFKKISSSTAPTGPITFSLKGTFNLTGTFSTADLIQQVLGKNLAQSNVIFEKYSTIATAHAILSPFWRTSFPDSPQKISVIIQ